MRLRVSGKFRNRLPVALAMAFAIDAAAGPCGTGRSFGRLVRIDAQFVQIAALANPREPAAFQRYARASWRTGAPRAALSLVRIEAAITAIPTTATMMLQTAFISGLTPSRTSE